MVLLRRNVRRQPRKKGWTKGQMAMAKAAVNTAGRMYRAFQGRKTQVSAVPSRYRASPARGKQTLYLERALRNFAGRKYQGYTGDCLMPVSKPAGTQPISYHFYNSGKQLGANLPEYNPMNLFKFAKGDANDERVGNYMTISKSHIKMEIQTLPLDSVNVLGQPVIQFRLMVIKANRKFNSLGSSPDPGESLFLNTQNEQFGYDGTTATTFLNFAQPINKRKWLVYRDQRFKLSCPSETLDSTASERVQGSFPKYNTKKYIEFDLPVHKKCHFVDSEDEFENVPENLDSQWLIILQAANGSYCTVGTTAPRNYAVNMLGTTSAYDC